MIDIWLNLFFRLKISVFHLQNRTHGIVELIRLVGRKTKNALMPKMPTIFDCPTKGLNQRSHLFRLKLISIKTERKLFFVFCNVLTSHDN
jgi:hypothetical protein